MPPSVSCLLERNRKWTQCVLESVTQLLKGPGGQSGAGSPPFMHFS